MKDSDKLGEIIDSIDNLVSAMDLPMPPQMHLDILKGSLTEKVKELKEFYIAEENDNPWL